MILQDDEVKERIESPLNLLNRLKSVTKTIPIPVAGELVDSDEIIEDLEDKIKHGAIRSRAADIMTAALAELKQRIPEVQKPEKLAQIAGEMNKVLISRQERDRDLPSQIIVYSPKLIDESYFNTIVVNER